MSRQRTTPVRGPGNDGSWYLDLLGVDGRRSAATKGDAAQAAADIEPDPLEGWSPRELSRTANTRRSFRWSVVVIGGLLAVLAGLVIWWVPRITDQRIAARLERVRTAVAEARTQLGPLQNALATATEPSADATALTATAPVLATAAAVADDLAREGVAPLPDPVPLVGNPDLDTLADEQGRFSFMAAEAAATTQRIAVVVDYRVALDGILVLPDLPTSVSGEELNALGVELASSLADSVSAAAALPADAALAEHAAAVAAALTRFGDWQVEYLDALRRDREEEAAVLAAEITTLVSGLDDLLVPALSTIRVDIDTAILELASQLENSLLRLPL